MTGFDESKSPTTPLEKPGQKQGLSPALGHEVFDWIGRDPHDDPFYSGWKQVPPDYENVVFVSYKMSSGYWSGQITEDFFVPSAFRNVDVEVQHVVSAHEFESLDVAPHLESVGQLFRELADEWIEATREQSSPRSRVMHRAYQKIIGLGRPALGCLLVELRDRPDDWFWALAAISREDPSPGVPDPDAARDAWLEWGVARGLINHA